MFFFVGELIGRAVRGLWSFLFYVVFRLYRFRGGKVGVGSDLVLVFIYR